MSIIDASSRLDMAAQEMLSMIVVNKCRARAVGALIQYLDGCPPAQDIEHSTIDQWNEEFHADTEDEPEWGSPCSAFTQAKLWHSCAEYMNQWCSTLTPLSIERMTMFMCTDGQERKDEQTLSTVSLITGDHIDSLRILAQKRIDQRKTRLAERQPIVIEMYRAFGEEGSADAFDQLTPDEHERLFESVVEAIPRQRSRFIERALRGDELATQWLQSLNTLQEVI